MMFQLLKKKMMEREVYEQGNICCHCSHVVEMFYGKWYRAVFLKMGSWTSNICIIGKVLDSEIRGMGLAIQNLKNTSISFLAPRY